MGRELRRVPKGWSHPRDNSGHYIPLLGQSFGDRLGQWEKGKTKWDQGLREDYSSREGEELSMTYEQWSGEKPMESDFMPQWPESEKTHIQLYETTSEGTPVSPVYPAENIDALCEYAAKYVSTFADMKTTKENWKKMLSDGLVYTQSGNVTFI